MYFPVVVYWCQYNWLSASLIKFLLESKFAAKMQKPAPALKAPDMGIMKLSLISNLIVNEAAPVCVSLFQIRDMGLMLLRIRMAATDTLSVYKWYFTLSHTEKFKSSWFSDLNRSQRGINVLVLFWKDGWEKEDLFLYSFALLRLKTYWDATNWMSVFHSPRLKKCS